MCRRLAEALGGQLAFTRPMVENGFGDQMHQIGLSGRTVRPRSCRTERRTEPCRIPIRK